MTQGRILCVDDEESVRRLVGAYLQKAGYEVAFAFDGVDALQKISELGHPDLVLTDVSMPNMTGLELTRRLRSHHKTARIPVIMLSGHKQAEDMLAGYAEGADDYAPKPIELSVLVAKIESLLKRHRAATSAATAEPGRVVVFMHGKGGVGATTLAVNTAVALAQPPTKVALVDLSLEFPSVGVFLNVQPRHTLADLSELQGPVDDDTFSHFLVRHQQSPVRVLVGCDLPERAELVTIPAIQQALDRLRAAYDWVVVDCAANFSEKTLYALDQASAVVVVSGASVPSLKATLDCLLVLEKLSFPVEREVLVLNRTTPLGVTVEQAGKFFGRSPLQVIGHSELFDHAANAGVPLVVSHPDYPGSRDVRELCGYVMRATEVAPRRT